MHVGKRADMYVCVCITHTQAQHMRRCIRTHTSNTHMHIDAHAQMHMIPEYVCLFVCHALQLARSPALVSEGVTLL